MPYRYGANKTLESGEQVTAIAVTYIAIRMPRHDKPTDTQGFLVTDENGLDPYTAADGYHPDGYIETWSAPVEQAILEPFSPKEDRVKISVEYMDSNGNIHEAILTMQEAITAGVDVEALEAALKVAIYAPAFLTKASLPTDGVAD
jgi:hypothetical protein